MSVEDALIYLHEIYTHLLEQGTDECPEVWLLAIEKIMEEM